MCAYHDETLAGFVTLARDGGVYAFLLDATVRPDLRLRGIGRELVRRAAGETIDRGVEWLHWTTNPTCATSNDGYGFSPTVPGLMRFASGWTPPGTEPFRRRDRFYTFRTDR